MSPRNAATTEPNPQIVFNLEQLGDSTYLDGGQSWGAPRLAHGMCAHRRAARSPPRRSRGADSSVDEAAGDAVDASGRSLCTSLAALIAHILINLATESPRPTHARTSRCIRRASAFVAIWGRSRGRDRTVGIVQAD
jgi:hypothetical protein